MEKKAEVFTLHAPLGSEADPHPVVNDIYEWDEAGFHKANECFQDYYRNLLPRIESELETIKKGRKLDVPGHKALLERKYEKGIEEINRILDN